MSPTFAVTSIGSNRLYPLPTVTKCTIRPVTPSGATGVLVADVPELAEVAEPMNADQADSPGGYMVSIEAYVPVDVYVAVPANIGGPERMQFVNIPA